MSNGRSRSRLVTNMAEEAQRVKELEFRQIPDRFFYHSDSDTLEKIDKSFDLATSTNNEKLLIETVESAENYLRSKQIINEELLLKVARKVVTAYVEQINLGHLDDDRMDVMYTLVLNKLITPEQRETAMQGFLRKRHGF